jgi:hypothetical protein
MFKKFILIISILAALSPNIFGGFDLAYRGYNAYSMSLGLVTQGDPAHFIVVEDRVFYFINDRTKARFEANLEENIKRADEFFESL